MDQTRINFYQNIGLILTFFSIFISHINILQTIKPIFDRIFHLHQSFPTIKFSPHHTNQNQTRVIISFLHTLQYHLQKKTMCSARWHYHGSYPILQAIDASFLPPTTPSQVAKEACQEKNRTGEKKLALFL